MRGPYKAVKVSEHVWWVGAIDRTVKEFHGYRTPRGTTYNAYLIIAEKITLVDMVKESFYDEMMCRIEDIIDPSKIDYIVSNHAEKDHTGCMLKVLECVKPEKIFTSTMGAMAIKEQFRIDPGLTVVKEGETISLGNMNLTFKETRMLHWPDSMVSYLDADGVLFSQDIFGMHLGSYKRFDDEITWDMLEWEAKTYYANIITPYSDQVLAMLDKFPQLGFNIKLVCPDHGPIWRKDFAKILELYRKWATQKSCMKVVLLFDSMWHATEMMAHAIAEGLTIGGADVYMYPLGTSHRTFIMTEVLESSGFICGSSTLNKNLLPEMADILTYIKGLSPRSLTGFAFGSYGWSGEAAKQISEVMTQMKVEQLYEPFRVKYTPSDEDLKKLFDMGKETAIKLSEKCKL